MLAHFEPILTPLLEEQQPTLLAFRSSIESDAERLGQILSDLAAFAERYAYATVPLFLIATPAACPATPRAPRTDLPTS